MVADTRKVRGKTMSAVEANRLTDSCTAGLQNAPKRHRQKGTNLSPIPAPTATTSLRTLTVSPPMLCRQYKPELHTLLRTDAEHDQHWKWKPLDSALTATPSRKLFTTTQVGQQWK